MGSDFGNYFTLQCAINSFRNNALLSLSLFDFFQQIF